MKTGIKEFCLKYKKKIINDKEIQKASVQPLQDFRERINFYVTVRETAPGYFTMGVNSGDTLIKLDNEDIEYLYQKYSKKLQEEMEENINKIKKEYNSL